MKLVNRYLIFFTKKRACSIKNLAEICGKSRYIINKCLQEIMPYCSKDHHGREQLFRANLELLDNIEKS